MNSSAIWKHITTYPLCILLILAGLNCAGVGLISDKYSEEFYTVPKLEPEVSADSDITFLVYSDNQAGWRVTDVFLDGSRWTSWKMLIFPFYQLYLVGNGIVGAINGLRHTPDYGGRERRLVRDALYEEAKRSKASFILNVGDMVAHDGRRPAHWASFIRENKIDHPLLYEIPYLPVIGNHEHANDTTFGYPNYQAVFNYPRFYVTEIGPAVLIVVDSNLLVDQYQDVNDDAQDEIFRTWFVSEDPENKPSWLEQQLATYDTHFTIVAVHNPPLSFGLHHKDWLDETNGRDLLKKRRALLELFQQYNVDLVLSGHDHLYQHTMLTFENGGEMHFLVDGGGGSPLRRVTDPETVVEYQQHYESEGFNVSLINMARVYHYYRVEVGRSVLIVDVIEVTGNTDSPTKLLEKIVIEKS